MKKTIAGFSLLIICVLITLVFTQSCSNNKSQPTSQYNIYFGDINWPEKYVSDVAKSDLLGYSATVVSGQSGYCWSTMNWRPTWSAPVDVPYDTQTYIVSSGTNVFSIWHPYSSSRQALGIYTITIGLTTDTSHFGDETAAVETWQFNQYVGTWFYEHDVDFEYVFQRGVNSYDIFYWNNLSDMAEPYRDTRVHFVKHDLKDWSAEPPAEDVLKDIFHLVDYNDRFASVWPEDTSQQECRYVLYSISHLLDSNSTISDAFGIAVSGGDVEWAFVACGRIDELVSYYAEEVKMKVAAHEMGHLIGEGLKDYCDPNHQANHSDSTCLMSYFTIDAFGDPWWGCNGAKWDKFDGSFHFCSGCLQRLNDVDFLLSDYRKSYVDGSGETKKRLKYGE